MTGPKASAGGLLWPILALGVAGDLLFRANHLGLNVLVWTGGAVLVWHSATRRLGGSAAGGSVVDSCPAPSGRAAEPPSRSWERGLLVCALALAAAWVWRDNAMLRFLDALALILVFALLPLARVADCRTALGRLTVAQLLRALAGLAGRGVSGLLPTVLEAERESRDSKARRTLPLGALARGLMIAVPTGAVFGTLLGSADPVFGDAMRRIVAVDPEVLIGHVLGVTLAAWIAAAILRGLLPAAVDYLSGTSRPPSRGLGAIEIGLTLGVVDLLFAGFIAWQVPYFFGGTDWVQRTMGVTLAEYARRGFFELVVVTALVLPLLLLLNTRLTPDDPRARRCYRWLAGIQVALLLAIIGSGMHRMALYQGEFGLTQDRLFASAFMAGAAVTCAWFIATVLQGRALLFARGALVAWGVWLALLNLANPDRLIVTTNLRRHAVGKSLDASHLARLGTDAVPALVAALPSLADPERAIVRDGLMKRSDIYSTDLRDWHYGRERARRAILTLHDEASP